MSGLRRKSFNPMNFRIQGDDTNKRLNNEEFNSDEEFIEHGAAGASAQKPTVSLR